MVSQDRLCSRWGKFTFCYLQKALSAGHISSLVSNLISRPCVSRGCWYICVPFKDWLPVFLSLVFAHGQVSIHGHSFIMYTWFYLMELGSRIIKPASDMVYSYLAINFPAMHISKETTNKNQYKEGARKKALLRNWTVIYLIGTLLQGIWGIWNCICSCITYAAATICIWS